ncbi:MAG TPA: hypothetical protein GXX53_00340 [Tissierellia bacterium]|nr:hypothetical protein [Tissierellia bacterium]
MKLKGKTTSMVILSTVLWVVITLCGWMGHHIVGMVLGVVLMLIHMMLGASRNGELDKKFFIYPLLSWAVLWTASFILSEYHSNLYGTAMPDFTILGFHPSFAWTVLTYWIGGMLTLTAGFVLYKDLWLSEEDWDNFRNSLQEINQKRGLAK